MPIERVDAVVAGDALGLALAEELERLEPCGMGNPRAGAARAGGDVHRPAGDGGGPPRALHRQRRRGPRPRRRVRRAGGAAAGRRRTSPSTPPSRSSQRTWNGAVEPRLRAAQRPRQRARRDRGAGRAGRLRGRGAGRAGRARSSRWPRRGRRSRAARCTTAATAGSPAALGRAGGLRASPCSSCAPTPTRRVRGAGRTRSAASRCARTRRWSASPRSPIRYPHVVRARPAGARPPRAPAGRAARPGHAHLAYGPPELRFARSAHEHEYGLRELLADAVPGPARPRRRAGGELEALLRGDAERPRSAAAAGRLPARPRRARPRRLDRGRAAGRRPRRERTELERSPAFRAYERRLRGRRAMPERATARAA